MRVQYNNGYCARNITYFCAPTSKALSSQFQIVFQFERFVQNDFKSVQIQYMMIKTMPKYDKHMQTMGRAEGDVLPGRFLEGESPCMCVQEWRQAVGLGLGH